MVFESSTFVWNRDDSEFWERVIYESYRNSYLRNKRVFSTQVFNYYFKISIRFQQDEPI